MKRIEHTVERAIFISRWLLLPMYLGLIVALALYAWKFLIELRHIYHDFNEMGEAETMISVLTLIDMSMIGNLISMILIGSYEIFVSPIDFPGVVKPGWLRTIGSGLLKVKMGMSLVGISSIHLLKDFIEINTWGGDLMTPKVFQHLCIHVVFLLSALAMAWVDKIIHPAHPPAHPEPVGAPFKETPHPLQHEE